jgi:heat shock protein HslJ
MTMKKSLAALVLPLAGLAACDGTTGPSSASLEGRWQLVSLQASGGPEVPAPSGATFTAEFGSDARLSLVADCNRCGSTYEAGSGTLSVGQMACTLAYCPTAPVDTQFAGLVQASQNWRLENGELKLVSAEGTLRLQR